MIMNFNRLIGEIGGGVGGGEGWTFIEVNPADWEKHRFDWSWWTDGRRPMNERDEGNGSRKSLDQFR